MFTVLRGRRPVIRIFIAHASEQKQLASEIAVKLRTRDHVAFLDADSLPPGDTYDDRIRAAVEECEIFVFLISADSVRPGKYALTELGYAKKRWPNPVGRILPVLVDDSELDGVDPYLSAVTALRPVGSAATEVLGALEAMYTQGAARDQTPGPGPQRTVGRGSLGVRLASHPVFVVVGALAALASIIGVTLQFFDRSAPVGSANDDVAAPTAPTSTEGVAATTSDGGAVTTEAATTTFDDQALANLTVIQTGDLSQGWTAFDARSRNESVASYEAFAECVSVVPIIRGDGETAISGRDVFYVDGNTAVSVIVAFYEDAGLARSSGPELLLDLDYQRCVRAKLRASIEATNPTAQIGGVASTDLPAPSYGQRTEAVSHVATFNIPELGDKEQFTDEWAIQIGRAVLLMTWSSDQEFDPFELELFQVLGSRFEREMALYSE